MNDKSSVSIAISADKAKHEYLRMLKGETRFDHSYLSELVEIHGIGKSKLQILGDITAEFETPTCDECGTQLVYVDCGCGDGCHNCWYDGGWLTCNRCGGELKELKA